MHLGAVGNIGVACSLSVHFDLQAIRVCFALPVVRLLRLNFCRLNRRQFVSLGNTHALGFGLDGVNLRLCRC